MRPWITGVSVAGVLMTATAGAQTPDPAPTSTTTSAVDIEAITDQIREQLRDELKEELKAELKREIQEELEAEADVLAPVESDDWADTEWSWEEPTEPELNFLELDGYFRLRWDLFNNLDMGTFRSWDVNGNELIEPNEIYGPFAEPFVYEAEGFGLSDAPPVPMCPTDSGETGCAPANSGNDIDTLAGANMRLRLEPTLNVFEDIKVKSQIDVLDNVVLGSNPDSFPFNPMTPLSAFTNVAQPPSNGINSVVSDSIRVKRLWGEVTTPLGQLRFGRQPNHFGMGITHNDGRGIDDDFGDNVDRVLFAVKLGDFYIMPAYDWLVSGPTSATFYDPFGQPFDRGERDDVERWNLIVTKEHDEETVRQMLQNDRVVWQAGGYGTFRKQNWDVPDFYREGDIENQANENRLVERHAAIGTGNFWAKLQWRQLTIEAEYGFMYGNINNPALTRDPDDGFETVADAFEVNQHGAALRGEYKFLKNDALKIEFLTLFASGDPAPGWGIRPLLGKTGGIPNRIGGYWDGNQSTSGSPSLTNFRFNPAYYFDIILWRQMIGTLTDAVVVRPSVQYNITKELGGRFDMIYSHALFSQSTPSNSLDQEVLDANNQAADLGGPSNPLGFELDFKLFFDSDDGFHAWFQYGLFIPMDAMDRLVARPERSGGTQTNVNGTEVTRLNASLVHSLQILLGISF